MLKFDEWYEQQKEMIQAMNTRKDVAFYVWNNKPKTNYKPSVKATEAFEEFWKAYPRHDAKQVALVSWNKLKPPIIDVMEALAWQTKQENWLKDNGKFIPHAATWLNQRRWEDEKPIAFKEEQWEYYVDMNGIKKRRLKI